VIALAPGAGAHERTTSYSTWTIRGPDAHVTVRISWLDVSRFPWADVEGALGAYLVERVRLFAGDQACAVTEAPRPLASPPGGLGLEWRLRCPAASGLRLRSDLLLDVAPAHLHFARVRRDGEAPGERVLSEREREWALDRPAGTSVAGYVALGVEHITTGWDHLAFLLALLLLGGSFGQVVTVVTGFTVAHSLTLGLAVLGAVRPAAAPVEALVGLSIALVAVENVWLTGPRSRAVPLVVAGTLAVLALAAARGYGRVPALTLGGLALFSRCYFGLLGRTARAGALRWTIAFLFGLVHGFAFAAVLAEAGLPPGRMAPALFGFNLGVEAGQIAVVAVVWPLIGLAARHRLRPVLVEGGSAALAGLGLFWFVTRAYG
jgi:hypothetical protein